LVPRWQSPASALASSSPLKADEDDRIIAEMEKKLGIKPGEKGEVIDQSS